MILPGALLRLVTSVISEDEIALDLMFWLFCFGGKSNVLFLLIIGSFQTWMPAGRSMPIL
jgi:hypothetical protein